jgi:hypothetical protein
MAKSPNTTPINGISYSFSYSLPSAWGGLYQPNHPPLTEEQRIETENELAWLDYVESEFIQDMLTYPEAEAIIKKVMKQGEDDA